MKFKFVNSLKFKLSLFVGLGIVPTAILFVLVTSSLVKDSLANKTEELLSLKTSLIEDNINKWDEINRGILRSTSVMPAIVSMNRDRQKEILLSIVDSYDHLYRAMTIGIDGNNVARSDSRKPKYLGDRYYVRAAKEGEDIAYQSIMGRTSKKPAVCMGRSVADRSDAKVVGVIAICTYLQQIVEEIGQLKFGRTGYAIVVDAEGTVLAHPNPAYQVGDRLHNLASFPPVANLLSNGDKDFSFRQDGEEWVSRSVRLQNGWGAIVIMNKAEFLADEREFEETILFIGLCFPLLLAFLAWNFGNHLISPIAELNSAAIALREGKYQTLNVKRSDEFGSLAIVFNQAAKTVSQKYRQLEDIVSERTASLQKAHHQTLAALEKAQLANQNKENFLHKITHELKTPLNAIIGYSQILLQKNTDSRIWIIHQSAKHLSLMLDDIFDFNAGKTGKIILKPEAVNLEKLATEAIEIIKLNISDKLSISLKIETLPVVKVDRKRLLQVLINLLTNSVKFTNSGEISLKISSVNETLKNLKVVFEVKDTGIGISQENLPQIFSPYFSTDSSGNGTGLGLSITNQIVMAMGGKIHVESELNSGSSFSFKLNLLKVDNGKRETFSTIRGYQGNTRKILFVDDDRRLIELVRSFLEPLGFEITEALNGKDAIKIATERSDLDLIITDYYMPVQCGLTMIYQLRRMPNYQHTPIIITSSKHSKLIRQHSTAQGANAFLNKPFNPEDLLFYLEKFLKLNWIKRSEQQIKDFQQKLIATENNFFSRDNGNIQ